jgi:hypothetical protein
VIGNRARFGEMVELIDETLGLGQEAFCRRTYTGCAWTSSKPIALLHDPLVDQTAKPTFESLEALPLGEVHVANHEQHDNDTKDDYRPHDVSFGNSSH